MYGLFFLAKILFQPRVGFVSGFAAVAGRTGWLFRENGPGLAASLIRDGGAEMGLGFRGS